MDIELWHYEEIIPILREYLEKNQESLTVNINEILDNQIKKQESDDYDGENLNSYLVYDIPHLISNHTVTRNQWEYFMNLIRMGLEELKNEGKKIESRTFITIFDDIEIGCFLIGKCEEKLLMDTCLCRIIDNL